MKAIDFCCGAGGATAGVRAAGASVVAAFDIDPHALATHRANHPRAGATWGNLLRADWRDLPGHEAAVWCPPCEEVSHASGRTAYDAAIPLMERLLDYAAECRPRYLLFENVPAITGWRGHHAWRCGLEAAGYWVTDGLVQAADFVPQERTRYLCLAARGTRAPRLPPARVKRPVSARKILDTDTARGQWRFVAGATEVQRSRIARARERFGAEFLLSGYGARGGALRRPLRAKPRSPDGDGDHLAAVAPRRGRLHAQPHARGVRRRPGVPGALPLRGRYRRSAAPDRSRYPRRPCARGVRGAGQLKGDQ